MSKTKIVCTIGPASRNKKVLKEMLDSGLSVVRCNLSQASRQDQTEIIQLVNELRAETGTPLPVLFDTRGPEIRTKYFVNDQITVNAGDEITVCNGDFKGTNEKFCITYPILHRDVEKGSIILIDDGCIELEVKEVVGEDIVCIVKNPGVIKNKKGVNVPNINLDLPPITDLDKDDLKFGLENDIDFIAASFIRSAADVNYIREFCIENNCPNVKIISKIENQQGIDNIDEIIEVSDGIMVARGDLGVETPAELIPLYQKMMINKCKKAKKPVITATQMVDSMVSNPRPTRAEVSDVANAVFDGTDAIMLSAESAVGKYPVQAVQMLEKIASVSENTMTYDHSVAISEFVDTTRIDDVVSQSACSAAINLSAKAIVCPTLSGKTARLVSSFRPTIDIIATTFEEKVRRQMNLLWGITPLLVDIEETSEALINNSIAVAKEANLIACDDNVVITAGLPVGGVKQTNAIQVVKA